MIVSIVLILLTLLLSAFFSGMEIAFLSKNRLRLKIDRKQSRPFDFIAEIFERHPGQYITSILVGNNIALVLYSLYMSALLRGIAALCGWSEIAERGSLLLETCVSTLLIIFAGEFIPKSIFRGNPNFYYRFFAPLMYIFYIVLYPIARLTTLVSFCILRLFGRRVADVPAAEVFDKADLASLLDSNPAGDAQHENDSDMDLFRNALDFADLRVRDCMVPRIDVEAVDIEDTSIEELTARFVESSYSRIFVWRESIDNIIGYVNSKSLFTMPESIEAVMMKVDYVAETMPLQALLGRFTKKRRNIAVVIDEFGGTAGIISLEDVLEQIFGEIEDEHDSSDLTEKRVGENEYVFSCRLEVKYLNEKYGLGIEESDEYDTLAGYIIYRHEGIPEAGHTITAGDMRIRILRISGSRVELARITTK
ncbi:MAG: HlyC/CorC family transporter [Alistipes sp.]|nr:HlyC/CorC family transporter [Alistipes sp.]